MSFLMRCQLTPRSGRRAVVCTGSLALAMCGCASGAGHQTNGIPTPPADAARATVAGSAVPEPADTVLLHTALAVTRIAPQMSDVWTGFWPADQAFMLYRPAEAVLLISNVAPPARFLPIEESALPDSLRGRAYLYRGALPGLETGFRIDYPAGATVSTAVAVHPHGLRASVITLFHEAFHGYQRRHFAAEPSAVGEFVDPSQIAAPEFRAMAEVERRMLAAALDLPEDRLASHMRQYLAVRWVRTRTVPLEVRMVERNLERTEGSAHLVGLNAGLLSAGESASQLADTLRPYLTGSLDRHSGGLSERLIRWRVYGTGAAVGLLLDRMGVQWRERMEAGTHFDDLLADAVGFDSAAVADLAQHALERYGFAEVMTVAAEPAGQEIRSLDDFFALAPVRVIVEFAAPFEDERLALDLNLDAGSDGFAQLEPSLLAMPSADIVTVQNVTGSLVVRGRPVLLDTRDVADERATITVLLPAMPLLDGGEPITSGEHPQGLRLSADGFELTFDAAVSVQAGTNELTIRPLAAGTRNPTTQ